MSMLICSKSWRFIRDPVRVLGLLCLALILFKLYFPYLLSLSAGPTSLHSVPLDASSIQAFPLQLSNFSETAHLEHLALRLRKNPNTSKFIRYDNSRMQCEPFVASHTGVFSTPPEPPVWSYTHGINHQRLNLEALLIEAAETGRVAVLEDIALTERHNYGRFVCAPWSRYVDIPGIHKVVPIWIKWRRLKRLLPPEDNRIEYFTSSEAIDKLKRSTAKVVVRSLDTPAEYIVRKLVPKHSVSSVLTVRRIMVESEYVRSMSEIAAAQVTDNFTRNLVCVKVRRGDKLKENYFPCLDPCTRPEHILQLLELNNVSKSADQIYLMTNEVEKDFFKPLTDSGYLVNILKDVPLFQDAKLRLDNYMVFAIELSMCKAAKGGIGTFRPYINYWGDINKRTLAFSAALIDNLSECRNGMMTGRRCHTSCARCMAKQGNG